MSIMLHSLFSQYQKNIKLHTQPYFQIVQGSVDKQLQ